MNTPINLRKRFGRRYRVEHEESHRAEHGPNARVNDPRMMLIPCRYGQVFPYDGTTLAASVDGFPKVAGRLWRLACCRIQQDGDFGELTVLFDAANFAKVARIMRPRRRRQVSPRERERLRAMGFKKESHPHVDVQYSGRRTSPTPQMRRRIGKGVMQCGSERNVNRAREFSDWRNMLIDWMPDADE